MGKRHRGANAFFSKPLTSEETSHIAKLDTGSPIKCFKCGLPGGTLTKEVDKEGRKTGRYYHGNDPRCELLRK